MVADRQGAGRRRRRPGDPVRSHAAARAKARAELTVKATFDALTGCYSRSSVLALLDRALAEDGEPVAVVYVDLDKFKPVNDTHGHAAGTVDRAASIGAAVSGPADTAEALIARADAAMYEAKRAGDRVPVFRR